MDKREQPGAAAMEGDADIEYGDDSGELPYYDEGDMASFVARAIQKQRRNDRISRKREEKGYDLEPQRQYRNEKREEEHERGHVGTSILDIRDKMTDSQAIRQELRAHGAADGDYEGIFRQAEEDAFDEYLDLIERRKRDAYPDLIEDRLSFGEVMGKYNGLFSFLGENTVPDPNIEQKYQAIIGQKEKLQFILDLPLVDKVKLFCSDNFGYANYDNFMHRLQFQQDFINGTATVWVNKWDSEQGKYVDVQEPLNPNLAKPADISLGLERASLRSAMIGTPEYGAYKMALDFAHDWEYEITSDFPIIMGYKSGIFKNSSGSSIGGWRLIIDEYQKIAEGTAKRRPDLEGEDLEYRAVRDAAWIFATSLEYNNTGRGPNSPYISSFHESVAWAQLGYPAKAQFRGMRQKIEGVDLHNIGRFLGKSGLNPARASYASEQKRLLDDQQKLGKLEKFEESDGLEIAIQQYNEREILKQNDWQEKETTRINHKYDKLISKTRSEERKAEFERRRNNELESLIADCNEKREYFSHRTLDQLSSDINSRLEVVEKRINKRKAIAEKAIDLYFALMPEYGGYGEDEEDEEGEEDEGGDSGDEVRIAPFQVRNVDWINEAPFGLIRKIHKLLGSGLSQPDLVAKAHRMSMDEASFAKWAVNEVAWQMDDYYSGGEHFNMAGASDFLRKAIGENFRHDADTSEIKQKISKNLYTYLPAIENNRDAIPVPHEYFSSDEIAKSAIDHLRALTDASLVADGMVPYYRNNNGRWGGVGIAKKLIDGYILPNQPDFFQNDDNKAFILRMLRQSAFRFQEHDAGMFQEIISISEEYLPSIYSEQIEHLRKIRNRLKEAEPASGSSRHERQPYENAVVIFSQIAKYDGVDFPDPAKVIRLAENGMQPEDLSRGLGNGFNIEEIVKYPFLCSELLKEPN